MDETNGPKGLQAVRHADQNEAMTAPTALGVGCRRSRIGGFWPAAALTGMAVLIAVARLHTYYEPMERDITTYAVAAHEMLNGRELYSQIWESKPPAIHVTYALAELVAGYGYGEIYLLGVFAAVVSLVGVYVAARALGGAGCGLWAAAFWTLACGDMTLQANQPNTEVFINACMVWALAVLFVRPGRPLGHWRAIGVGLLIGVASTYKQVIVPTAMLLAATHILVPPPDRKGSWRRRLGEVAIMAAAGIAVWAAVLAAFGAGDRFRSLYDALVVFNRDRAGSLWENLAAAFTPRRGAAALATAGMIVAGIVLWRRGVSRRTVALLGAWWLGTFVAVALPGKFYPHYFQLWLPLATVAAGVAVIGAKRLGVRRPQWASAIAGMALLAAGLAVELPAYLLTPQEWSVRKYGHDVFVESQKAAGQLAAMLQGEESFFNWGAESGLYFDSGRRPPSGIFFNFPLKNPRTAAAATRQLLAELAADPPELVIMHQTYLVNYVVGEGPVPRWLNERYDRLIIPGFSDQFHLFARRGWNFPRSTALLALDPAE